MTADEAMAPAANPEERSAPDGNMEWLRDFLVKGPMKASEAHEEAEQAGISQKALRTAREKLGIKPRGGPNHRDSRISGILLYCRRGDPPENEERRA
jgi:hypothetical protein